MTNPIQPNGPAAYPSDLGAFAMLPREDIAGIFSRIQGSDPGGPTPCACRDFQHIFQDPAIAYIHLENELSEKTTLTLSEISSYRVAFRQKYQRDLPLSVIFSKCPQLTTLDFSNSDIDNASLANILKAAGPRCPLHTLNLSQCTRLINI